MLTSFTVKTVRQEKGSTTYFDPLGNRGEYKKKTTQFIFTDEAGKEYRSYPKDVSSSAFDRYAEIKEGDRLYADMSGNDEGWIQLRLLKTQPEFEKAMTEAKQQATEIISKWQAELVRLQSLH